MAVTAAAARHVYGQKAYAACSSGSNASVGCGSDGDASRTAKQPATMPPCQTQTSIRRTVAHASLQTAFKCFALFLDVELKLHTKIILSI